ncbi:MAG: hypothetical protein ACEQSA_00510 [Weeksellaceae bacterium]
MIGHRYNDTRSGQALLMLVLVIAMVLTVVVATSFRLSTDTQQTRQQEESVRVLAAADSGIEKGIQEANAGSTGVKTFEELDLTLAGIDAENSKVYITQNTSTQFVSPIVQRDDQYIFYLSNYPTNSTYFTGSINLYFGSSGGASCGSGPSPRNIPALEVTLVQGDANTDVRRWLIDSCTTGQYIAADSNKIAPALHSPPVTLTVDESDYSFTHDVSANTIDIVGGNKPKMLIVRTLYENTRLGFVSSSSGFGSSANFLPQGKEIRAEARSISGTSKVVSLFQSLPQIPADFFVTTF